MVSNTTTNYITSNIDRIWQGMFEKSYLSDIREEKVLFSPDRRYSLKLFYSKNREDWNKEKENGSPRLQIKEDCFLCNHSTIKRWFDYDENLSIALNINPVLRYHCMASPSQHRPWLEVSDMESFYNIMTGIGYSGFANLPGAGAGFPDHIHFQMYPDRMNIFDEATTEEIFRDSSVEIGRLVYPVYGLRLGFLDNHGKQRVFSFIEHYNKRKEHQTFNLLFEKGALYFMPRIKEIPSTMSSFKFAGAEMGGFFFVRTREMFDSLDYATLDSSLKEATLTSIEEQQKLESVVISYFR